MKAKEEKNWFVYVAEIYGTKETLIASGLTQIEAQKNFDLAKKLWL